MYQYQARTLRNGPKHVKLRLTAFAAEPGAERREKKIDVTGTVKIDSIAYSVRNGAVALFWESGEPIALLSGQGKFDFNRFGGLAGRESVYLSTTGFEGGSGYTIEIEARGMAIPVIDQPNFTYPVGGVAPPVTAAPTAAHLQANVYASQTSVAMNINLAVDGGAPGLVGPNQQLIIGVTSSGNEATAALSAAGSASMALIDGLNNGSAWEKFYRITGLSQTTCTVTVTGASNSGGLQAWSVLDADQVGFRNHSAGAQTASNTTATALSNAYVAGDIILAHTRVYEAFSVPLATTDLQIDNVIIAAHETMTGSGTWAPNATVDTSLTAKIAQSLVLAKA